MKNSPKDYSVYKNSYKQSKKEEIKGWRMTSESQLSPLGPLNVVKPFTVNSFRELNLSPRYPNEAKIFPNSSKSNAASFYKNSFMTSRGPSFVDSKFDFLFTKSGKNVDLDTEKFKRRSFRIINEKNNFTDFVNSGKDFDKNYEKLWGCDNDKGSDIFNGSEFSESYKKINSFIEENPENFEGNKKIMENKHFLIKNLQFSNWKNGENDFNRLKNLESWNKNEKKTVDGVLPTKNEINKTPLITIQNEAGSIENFNLKKNQKNELFCFKNNYDEDDSINFSENQSIFNEVFENYDENKKIDVLDMIGKKDKSSPKNENVEKTKTYDKEEKNEKKQKLLKTEEKPENKKQNYKNDKAQILTKEKYQKKEFNDHKANKEKAVDHQINQKTQKFKNVGNSQKSKKW